MKALILDDDPVILSLLRGVLSRRGYDVVTCLQPGVCPQYNAQRCPCDAPKPCPDLILSDLAMPDVDGIEFIEKLRLNGCRCQHIGLMSGSWRDADIVRASQLGAHFIAKPFHLQQIHDWLDEIEQDFHADFVRQYQPHPAPALAAAV